MLSNSQKEHLTYTAVGQIVAIFAMSMVAYQYIMPGITKINALSLDSDNAIKSYDSTYNTGITTETLQRLLSEKSEYAELIKIIQSDPEYAKKILVKENMSITGSNLYAFDCRPVDYYTCIKSVLGKVEDEKESIKNEKAKLNSIIPTMSPYSNNIEENNITLREYVNYIEKSILQKFNFDSNVLIGMQGLSFGSKLEGIPESIGALEFRLDFKATNDDILKFIEFINETGRPDILSFTGKILKENLPDPMSNPLITMESFSVQERLDPDNPTKENSGRATLRFYFRGASKDDVKFLSESLKTRRAELGSRISESVKSCEKDGVICASYNKKLIAFQKKFQEYVRVLAGTQSEGGSSELIFSLNESAATIKSLENELESIIPKAKISN